MTELLKAWASQNKSLLFASHVLHEIEAITASFLLIHGGRLLASGEATEIEQLLADSPQEVEIFGIDVVKLVHRLANEPWVDGLQLLEGHTRLKLFVRDPKLLYKKLAAWIQADGLQIDRLHSAQGNLSAIFDSLVHHHRGLSQ